VQNAEDLDATDVRILTKERELLVAHNGSPVRLPDVLALAMPWLTSKAEQADSTGRFGIGLMTLQSLSPHLEIHRWPWPRRWRPWRGRHSQSIRAGHAQPGGVRTPHPTNSLKPSNSTPPDLGQSEISTEPGAVQSLRTSRTTAPLPEASRYSPRWYPICSESCPEPVLPTRNERTPNPRPEWCSRRSAVLMHP
jgi:hypothetical protein